MITIVFLQLIGKLFLAEVYYADYDFTTAFIFPFVLIDSTNFGSILLALRY